MFGKGLLFYVLLFLLCFDTNELELKSCTGEHKVICMKNKLIRMRVKEGGEIGHCTEGMWKLRFHRLLNRNVQLASNHRNSSGVGDVSHFRNTEGERWQREMRRRNWEERSKPP